MPNKPDFLVIGASRSGTSSLHNTLLKHPDLSGPNLPKAGNEKEVHFFDKKYSKGFDWYCGLFTGKKMNFESTPNYLYHPACPGRIKKHLPDCKFIVMFRNPIYRTWSHYRNWRKKEGWNINTIRNTDHLIIKKGIYIEQLMRWFQHFPKEQFYIIRSEDFYGNPERIAQDVCRWVGLRDVDLKSVYHDPANEGRKQPNQKEQQIPLSVKAWLRKFYKPYNELLYQFISRNMGWK